MPSVNVAISVNGCGGNINQTVTVPGDTGFDSEPTLPVGIAGELTTRTDNATGVLTLPTGHGITTSNTLDVYWGRGSANRRYGATVTATTTTTVSFDAGSGANLPSNLTNVVASPQVQVNIAIKPADLKLLAVNVKYLTPTETATSHLDFQDSSGAELLSLDIPAGNPAIYNVAAGIITNPFTGNPVAKVMASNGSSTNVATLQMICVLDATL